MTEAIDCWIYKSPRKDEMYLYLAAKDAFDDLPPALLARFGRPQFVMQLQLSEQRPLAREDVIAVIGNLRAQGFHLQMPPKLQPELYQGNED